MYDIVHMYLALPLRNALLLNLGRFRTTESTACLVDAVVWAATYEALGLLGSCDLEEGMETTRAAGGEGRT